MLDSYNTDGAKSFRLPKLFGLPNSFRQAKRNFMTLEAYLARPDALTLTRLAAELGISKGRLSQLKTAHEWPPELALRAERATDGRLSASALSSVIAQARAA